MRDPELIELHITLSVTVDPEIWRDHQFITEKGLVGDVDEYVRQQITDSGMAYFEHGITSVETIKVEQVKP